MGTSNKAAFVALGIALTGCSSAWRDENLDQELWWNMAEKGNSELGRPRDPFACPAGGDSYSCLVSSRSYLEQRCAERDADACYRVGRTLLLQGYGAVAREDARRFLELGCRVGWEKGDKDATEACTLLGVAHLVGLREFEPDPKLGAQLLGERCMMKDDLACAYFAYARERGLGVEPDLQRAVADYEGLCSVRHDGFEDDPAADQKEPPLRRWQPFACLRLAFLADNHVIDAPPELVAQLYAAVCFFSSGSGIGPSEPDPAAIGRIACPVAAERFLANGYAYRGLRATPGSYRTAEGALDLDTEGLAKRGCSDGSAESCTMLRSMFEGAEARGEIFDLR